MKIKMKRLFGILLGLTLVLGLMPGMSMTVLAADPPTITCDPTDGGTVDIEPSTDARWEYILTANPNAGYGFFYWTQGGGGQVSNLGGNRFGINGGQSITCVFKETCTVTYKVVGGTWSDGTTADKTVTILKDSELTGVPTGMVAATGYTGGSWDSDLSQQYIFIHQDTTFTYTFVADSSSTSPDDGSGSSDNNSSNNISSNNNNSSNDSGNSNSEPKDETPFDYLDPLREDLKAEIALGGERTVTWNQGTALPYDIMKTLQDNPGVTLIFSYTYQGTDYKVTISGKDAKAYTEIPWYGPLYLYKHYGSSSETAPANTTDTTTGERTYTVIPGDTLIGIAGKLNTTVESLVSLNDIKNRDFILVGQILKY